MALQRYKLTVAYRGTRYHGWQRQLAVSTWKGETPEPGCGIPTVQETLAKGLREVVRHPVTVVGSSRTDAGVHAKGQIAHFDTDQGQIPTEGLRMALNHQLPEDILVRSIEPVSEGFDAITSAVRKRYQYFIWTAPDRNPFIPDGVWHRWQELDTAAMRSAAGEFLGEHDFTSFVRPGHGRQNAVRTIYDCKVSTAGHKMVIGIEGNGFLWNMVRIMVGTLVEVGLGRYSPSDIGKMMAAQDRRAGGSTAPPHGLYLQWIKTLE
ncbi:MAG: tRNA pseudouridine(38-40) synthase TruA [Tepidisphaeraceae bacterium]|jgi:tRNA pseudouridine38-40 synthase